MKPALPILFLSFFLTVGIFNPKSDGAVVSTVSDPQDLVEQLSSETFKRENPTVKLKVWEPHENQEVIYEGYLLTDVLNFIYGNEWKKKDLVRFVCADGYKASVLLGSIESEVSILAFKKLDSEGHPLSFTLNNHEQHEANVNLAPFYLVWNNEYNSELRAEGGTNWPYQILSLEIWNYNDLFKKSLPPPAAEPKIKAGFVLFQKYCSTCHQVNGEGGEKGIELISTQIIQNTSTSWLKKWIDDPASLKPGTSMPPLNKNLKNRDEAIDDIILYLRSMTPSP